MAVRDAFREAQLTPVPVNDMPRSSGGTPFRAVPFRSILGPGSKKLTPAESLRRMERSTARELGALLSSPDYLRFEARAHARSSRRTAALCGAALLAGILIPLLLGHLFPSLATGGSLGGRHATTLGGAPSMSASSSSSSSVFSWSYLDSGEPPDIGSWAGRGKGLWKPERSWQRRSRS